MEILIGIGAALIWGFGALLVTLDVCNDVIMEYENDYDNTKTELRAMERNEFFSAAITILFSWPYLAYASYRYRKNRDG